MSEIRQDPVSGRKVILAPDRARRPLRTTVTADPHGGLDAEDPFAEGNESATTPEVLAIRRPGTAPNSPGWSVRVVTNLFPAVSSGPVLSRDSVAAEPEAEDLFATWLASGVHEVIVECPQGESNAARLGSAQWGDVFRAYRERLRTLATIPELAAAVIFKNQGALAGASLPHCHSQLIAIPFIPTALQHVLDRTQHYFQRHGRSVVQDVLEHELQHRVRIVAETEHFVAWCPFASRFAYEIHLMSRLPGAHFGQLQDAELGEAAGLYSAVLQRLDRVLPNLAFNAVLQTAPLHHPESGSFRWTLEILPRTTHVAGFEWGSDCYINTVLPEVAAEQLRQAAN